MFSHEVAQEYHYPRCPAGRNVEPSPTQRRELPCPGQARLLLPGARVTHRVFQAQHETSSQVSMEELELGRRKVWF
jgi:hypothetical protein